MLLPTSSGARSLRAALLSVATLATASLGTAEILYRETFSGSSNEPLAGMAPETRSGMLGSVSTATWIGPALENANTILADGTLRVAALDKDGASAWLPFVPHPGNVYLLKIAGLSVTGADWVGVGFTTARPPTGDKRMRYQNPVFWGLIRREGSTLTDQTFIGPETEGVKDATTTSANSLAVLLDTRGQGTWSVRWFLNGKLVRTEASPQRDITYVGFGYNTAANAPATPISMVEFKFEALDAGADTDRDGLHDSWELVYFRTRPGETTVQTLMRQDNSGDPDGDGYTNYEEFIAESDPTNSKSTPLDANGNGIPDSKELRRRYSSRR